MNHIIKKRKTIAMTYHFSILVMVIVGVNIKNGLLVSIGIFHFLTFRRMPVVRYIQSKLITRTSCNSCGNNISLNNHWKCGCGYISPEPKHVFIPCPACSKIVTVIKCHVCDIGILI